MSGFGDYFSGKWGWNVLKKGGKSLGGLFGGRGGGGGSMPKPLYSRKGTKRREAAYWNFINTPWSYEPTLSPQHQAAMAARVRSGNDEAANQIIGSMSNRMGGDTGSPLFQLLSSGARGGAAARSAGTMADIGIQDMYRSQDLWQNRADNMFRDVSMRSGIAANTASQKLSNYYQNQQNQGGGGLGQLLQLAALAAMFMPGGQGAGAAGAGAGAGMGGMGGAGMVAGNPWPLMSYYSRQPSVMMNF